MSLIPKILSFIISLSLFASVVYLLEPPKSWPEASLLQILGFFIPLLLTLTFFFQFFFNYFPRSFMAGLGGMMLLTLQAANQLNIYSGIGVAATTILAIRLFPKMRLPRFRPFHKNNLHHLKKLK